MYSAGFFVSYYWSSLQRDSSILSFFVILLSVSHNCVDLSDLTEVD